MKRFKRQFRKVDLYAIPISFRYKGEKKFYTNFGALTSVLVVLLVLSYCYSQIMLMLAKTKYTERQTISNVINRDFETGFQSYEQLKEIGNQANMTFGVAVYHKNGTHFAD
jgi:uncharacterized membrane protein